MEKLDVFPDIVPGVCVAGAAKDTTINRRTVSWTAVEFPPTSGGRNQATWHHARWLNQEFVVFVGIIKYNRQKEFVDCTVQFFT